MHSKIFQRFIEERPVPVMANILLERVFRPDKLNAFFDRTAEVQYTRELLFSTVFDLMNLVVFKTFPTVNAAYKDVKEDVGVSITSVYNKINGIEPETSSAMVRETAVELSEIVSKLGAAYEPWLPDYRIKILDGNCIEGTEHRLEVLRTTKAGALPGKALVIYDPAVEMATEVFLCEDGHAQERSMLGEVLATINAKDVLIMDRNFCVRSFLLGIKLRDAFFICRQHAGLPLEVLSELRYVGKTETGRVYEQEVQVIGEDGKAHKCRRICIKLNEPTRDGEMEINILTNLPKSVANGKFIAEIYRKRWKIETMFQELEAHLHSEINTLGYPKAALFGLCVAMVAYNVLAVVKASLRKVHGEKTIDNEVSGYYMFGNIARTYDGMIVAIEPEEWAVFHSMPLNKLTEVLLQLAANVKLEKYKKNHRGPKKPRPKRDKYQNKNHVSTARLLATMNIRNKSP